ncbi:MAG: hypothetical protein P4M15_02155 [Alphaproteobacteria bacterium]|nr:hypothetical protein [Alphaproteobacteria bacterium]
MRPAFSLNGLFLLAACLLAASPALAGNLTFDNGQTAWHSTQCTAPVPPDSVIGAASDTPGNDMNSLVAQHNIYVDEAQKYMDCISQEADRDQVMVNQAIASSAQHIVAQTQADVERAAAPLRARQEKMEQRQHEEP